MRRFAGFVFCFGFAYSSMAEEVYEFTLPSQVRVRIVEAPFSESVEAYDTRRPCLVNGRIPFGTDCNRPNSYVKRLSVSFAGRTHELDASSMYDSWGGRTLETEPIKGVAGTFRYFGGQCQPEGNCVFRGIFSDGAGTFAAEWVVFDGVSRRTILSSSGDVVNQISDNIDGHQ